MQLELEVFHGLASCRAGEARPYSLFFPVTGLALQEKEKERNQELKCAVPSEDANYSLGLEEVSSQHDLKIYHRSHEVLLCLRHPNLHKALWSKLLV